MANNKLSYIFIKLEAFSNFTNLSTPVERSDVPACQVGLGIHVGITVLMGQRSAGHGGHLLKVVLRVGTIATIHAPEKMIN